MSIDLINHKLTKSTKDKNNVTWWSNPSTNVKINSKGDVYSTETGKKLVGYNGGTVLRYAVKFDGKSSLASYNSLFSRMVLGTKLGAKTIKLKDKSKGYTDDNCIIVASRARNINVLESSSDSKTFNENFNSKENLFYTVYEYKNEHITEDGAVFPTKQLAEWHQEKVSKGKGNAQVVLDYNGGYVLAEQIYLQEVVYIKGKPYTNFIDVLNNNNGIVINVQEEHCKFDKLDSKYGFNSEICFMTLRKEIPEKVSKQEAEKIQSALEKYSDSVKSLNESISALTPLLNK